MTNPAEDALLARIKELEEALQLMIKYADWTVSDESFGYHPTFSSAIEVARKALNGDHS